MGSMQEKTILLIAGQPKAGTTSLFDWLSQHPQIAAGKLKELRFFLDPDYPLDSPTRFNGENLYEYLTLFRNPQSPVLMDASPDYFGCHAPLGVPDLHPDSKAVIIIRDPVERMISAYRFFKARGMVPADMSFDAYVEKQHREGVTARTGVQWRVLDHCRADHYVALWRAAYGDNLLVLAFEDLRKDPRGIIRMVCDFAGVESNADIDITHSNKTRTYMNPHLFQLYARVRRRAASRFMHHKALYDLLRPIGKAVSRSLVREQAQTDEIRISDDMRSLIAGVAEGNS